MLAWFHLPKTDPPYTTRTRLWMLSSLARCKKRLVVLCLSCVDVCVSLCVWRAAVDSAAKKTGCKAKSQKFDSFGGAIVSHVHKFAAKIQSCGSITVETPVPITATRPSLRVTKRLLQCFKQPYRLYHVCATLSIRYWAITVLFQ